MKKRYLPNILSCLRIVLAFGLLSAANHRYCVFVVFLLCGLTDLIDGYLARKWRCETELGARLDSLGDFIFFIALGVYLYLRRYAVIKENLILITLVFAIRIASLVVCGIKNKKVYSLHTISNKITGILLFLGIGLVILMEVRQMVGIVLIAALLSALEELIIMIRIQSPDPNIRSLFLRKKTE